VIYSKSPRIGTGGRNVSPPGPAATELHPESRLRFADDRLELVRRDLKDFDPAAFRLGGQECHVLPGVNDELLRPAVLVAMPVFQESTRFGLRERAIAITWSGD